MENLSLQDVAKKLASLIEGGRCVAWIGSGLSKPAGYPGWEDTLKKLCAACKVPPLTLNQRPVDEFLDKAEECKCSDYEAYCHTLANLFGGVVVSTRHAFNLLMQLPFRGYVTTNFDPLLASAGLTHNCTDLNCYPILHVGKLNGQSRPIFYLHGIARENDRAKGENLVLARSDFEAAYNGMLCSFLDQLLLAYPIIFIGCGLEEPMINASLQRVHKIHSEIKKHKAQAILPPRYALLQSRFRMAEDGPGNLKEQEDTDRERGEDERFNELAIDVLRYKASDDRHQEIELILEQLCALAEKPMRITTSEVLAL